MLNQISAFSEIPQRKRRHKLNKAVYLRMDIELVLGKLSNVSLALNLELCQGIMVHRQMQLQGNCSRSSVLLASVVCFY